MFSRKSIYLEITANVKKITKTVSVSLNFIFTKSSEKVSSLVYISLAVKINNVADLRKPFFFLEIGCLCKRNCVHIYLVINVNISNLAF